MFIVLRQFANILANEKYENWNVSLKLGLICLNKILYNAQLMCPFYLFKGKMWKTFIKIFEKLRNIFQNCHVFFANLIYNFAFSSFFPNFAYSTIQLCKFWRNFKSKIEKKIAIFMRKWSRIKNFSLNNVKFKNKIYNFERKRWTKDPNKIYCSVFLVNAFGKRHQFLMCYL